MSGKNKTKDDANAFPPVDDANLTDAEKAEKAEQDRRDAEERDTQRGFGQPPTPIN